MRICYLDMDGVLVDLVGGLCIRHNKPNPYIMPQYKGVWDCLSYFETTLQEHDADFWAWLPPMPDCFQIVALLESKIGALYDKIVVLTDPATNASVVGKLRWLHRNLPQYASDVIFTKNKGAYADVRHMLFDDKPENVEAFRPGNPVLVPRPWNHLHNQSHGYDYLNKLLNGG